LKIAPDNLPEARLMVLLLFGSLSLRLILVPFGVGLYVCQKFVLSNTLNTLCTLARALLLLVLLFGLGPRVLWVVVGSVAPDIALQLTSVVLSIRALPSLQFRFNCIRWELLPALMSFGAWGMIGSIGGTIRKSSDVLVLNRFATPIDVDTFQLACVADNQIDSVLIKILEPLQPHMVALYTAGGVAAVERLFSRCSRYILWLTLLVAVPAIVFRHQLWFLYLGPKLEVYPAAPLVMLLLLARYWIDMPIYLIGQVAYAMNRVRAVALLTISSSISNLAITIYFVHALRMGAVGSALGTLISGSLFNTIIIWPFSLKLLGMEFGPWFKAVVWRGVLPSVIAAFFGLAWRYWIKPSSIPALMLATGLVVLVFALSVLFCMDYEEQRQLKSLTAKFRGSGLAGLQVAVKSIVNPILPTSRLP
jgi:O-antigen/teichoic acid export membrane protein